MANARPVNIGGRTDHPGIHNSAPEADLTADQELARQAALPVSERTHTGDQRVFKLPGGCPLPGLPMVREDH